ncbi:MAG: hypothetical protein ACM3ZC_04445 [Bacteroidota bacterium]
MSLCEAITRTGPIPDDGAPQAVKKHYSEVLSRNLAEETAEGLRMVGFPRVKPERGGPGEKEFQGGLGPKKVDVSYSDEQHGLILAVSIKSINFAQFGKNLKNRFADLCTEAITLHMRFPYSVVCALFAFPVAADQDVTPGRTISTFQRATKLLATVSGRVDHTDPLEKYENVTMLLYQPIQGGKSEPWVRLIDARTGKEMTETCYFQMLRDLYNLRNPHSTIDEQNEAEQATNDV